MSDPTFTLADATIIRTDGDADGFAEIESVLAAEGVYEQPAGGSAGFRLEVVRRNDNERDPT